MSGYTRGANPLSLGARVAKTFGTTYLAASDGFVTLWGRNAGGTSNASIISDSNATPATTVAYGSSYLNLDYSNCSAPIRKGDYWKTGGNIDTSIGLYWVPLE